MKNLIIISSPGNNSGSFSYVKKIRKIQKEQFQDLEIIESKCKTQEDLVMVLNSYQGQVLILRPSTLILPHEFRSRNAEQYQVVDVIMSHMIHERKNTDKILLLGFGNVGKRVFEELSEMKYCVTVARSNTYMDDAFVNQFDMIINCSSGANVGWFYGSVVLDVAGNWVTSSRNESKLVDNVMVNTVHTPKAKVITVGEIGTLTTELMLGGE